MERNTATAARPAPRFAVGDWAFNPVMGHNARIVALHWDEISERWMYNTPGYCVFYIAPEVRSLPYHRYMEVRPGSWRDMGPCSRDDHNIPLQQSTAVA